MVRNRIIEKVRDPKPILSQTGSPMLPALPEYSNPRTGINLRRYQSSRTLPLTISKPAPAALQPYQEKEMIGKIQTSLQRYAPRPASIVDYPFPVSSSSSGYMKINYAEEANQSKHSNVAHHESNYKDHSGNFGSVGPLKIMNNQYNSPIGLYSNNNISEELKKQVGG